MSKKVIKQQQHQLSSSLCWSQRQRRRCNKTQLLLLDNNNNTLIMNNNNSINNNTKADAGIISRGMEEKDNSPNNNNNNNSNNPYAHNDSCNHSRWTSRESYEYMLNDRRPWHQVVHFYSLLISQSAPSPVALSLSSIFLPTHQQQRNLMPETQSICEDAGAKKQVSDIVSNSMTPSKKERKGGRWERVTFKIVLSYHGSSFDGWQKQPGLNTVQRSVEKTLGRFVDEMKAKQLTDRGLPVEGTAVVAGRTDKGVSALHQVCSFYTWRKDVKPQHIIDAFGEGEQGKLRIVSVSEVSRVFHPNFCAKWRRYLYIFPFNNGEVCMEKKHVSGEDVEGFLEKSMLEIRKKPMKFEISKVNELLSQLEGKLLSYKIFARDTKASRSTGPPTECFMFHARAAEARLPSSVQDGKCTKAMCVELVANRFLRKMVRVLVATAIREAAAGAEEDALIKLMDATCRRATAPPAPPEGLCLVDVGYDEFDPSICYI